MNNSYTVIIVSWNVRELLRRCLISLQPLSKQVQVIVVDNNSQDNSALMVSQDFSWVELIPLQENKGFALANNLAALQARGDYLVLLNPDTYIAQDFFNRLDDFWQAYPQTAVVGGQIKNEDGSRQPSVRKFPTVWSQLLVLLKLSRWLPGLLSDYLCANFDYNKPSVVDQVMGACFICSKKIWQVAGGFDVNFFVWFEEVDFCRRLKEINQLTRYEPTIKVWHSQKASFSQLDFLTRHKMFSRSLLYYSRKYFNWWSNWLLVAASFLGYLLAYAGKIFYRQK